MPENRFSKLRLGIITFLSGVIITGGIIAWAQYTPSQEIVITGERQTEWETTIYVGGAVNLPGYYRCGYEDSINSLIEAAGGISANSSIGEPVLLLEFPDFPEHSQKIDINRAELWLLKALPGIGDTLASRIIEYRNTNGLFNNIHELMLVEGIGTTIFSNIENYLTAADRQ